MERYMVITAGIQLHQSEINWGKGTSISPVLECYPLINGRKVVFLAVTRFSIHPFGCAGCLMPMLVILPHWEDAKAAALDARC